MNEQTRYRVTGALFLFAVSVIVLPMLFDGDGLPDVAVAPITQEYRPPTVSRFDDPAARQRLVEDVEHLRAEVDDEGFQNTNGVKVGQPVLSKRQSETGNWAVQVASFSEFDNATAFRSSLMDAGYEAFLSTAKRSGEPVHRVAVGPFVERDQAEALRSEVSQQFDVEARVVAFSP